MESRSGGCGYPGGKATAASCFDYNAEIGRNSRGSSLPPVFEHQVNFTIKEPYGVVAAIVDYFAPRAGPHALRIDGTTDRSTNIEPTIVWYEASHRPTRV